MIVSGKVPARYVVAAAVAVLAALLYFVAQPWSDLLVSLTDVMFVLVSGACSLFAFMVVRKWGIRGAFGEAHLGLFLFVLLQFFGELTWTIYEVVFHVEVPYPSLADLFYLAGYVAGIVGLMRFLSFFARKLPMRRIVLSIIFGLVIVGSTFIFLLSTLITEQADIYTKAFDVAYPGFDAILLSLVVAVFLTLKGGKLAPSWLWIGLGVLLTAIVDIIFSLGTLQGWYYSGHPIELLWVWGYVSMALGFYNQRTSLTMS